MNCESCGSSKAREYRNVYDPDEPNRIWCEACWDEDDEDYELNK